MSEQRLREYIENDGVYQYYKMKKPTAEYIRLHISLCRDIENVLNVLDEIREYIEAKLRNVNLTYGIDNEFREEYDDLLQILDKAQK